MRKLAPALLLLLLVALPALARSVREQQRIDFLIDAVAAMHDASFVRNGIAYPASKAADHLRRKLRYAGDAVPTAEAFIDTCATRSSLSGLAYTIRLADGNEVASADYLREQLAAYDRRHPPPG